jgi:hypothetical protein
MKISSTSGIEGIALEHGVGICLSFAAAETEFSNAQDLAYKSKSKGMLVFPLLRPGMANHCIGVLEVGNRLMDGPFSLSDEQRVAESAFLLSALLTRFPNDVTNPNALDPSIFNKPRDADRVLLTSSCEPLMVYRSGYPHEPRKSDLVRDAVPLQSKEAPIRSVLEGVGQVNDAWKSAVLLNIELENEIRRLHEALRVSRRETQCLQDALNEQHAMRHTQ